MTRRDVGLVGGERRLHRVRIEQKQPRARDSDVVCHPRLSTEDAQALRKREEGGGVGRNRR